MYVATLERHFHDLSHVVEEFVTVWLILSLLTTLFLAFIACILAEPPSCITFDVFRLYILGKNKKEKKRKKKKKKKKRNAAIRRLIFCRIY